MVYGVPDLITGGGGIPCVPSDNAQLARTRHHPVIFGGYTLRWMLHPANWNTPPCFLASHPVLTGRDRMGWDSHGTILSDMRRTGSRPVAISTAMSSPVTISDILVMSE